MPTVDDVVVVAPSAPGMTPPPTDMTDVRERSAGTAPIVPVGLLIVAVLSLLALPRRRTVTADR